MRALRLLTSQLKITEKQLAGHKQLADAVEVLTDALGHLGLVGGSMHGKEKRRLLMRAVRRRRVMMKMVRVRRPMVESSRAERWLVNVL